MEKPNTNQTDWHEIEAESLTKDHLEELNFKIANGSKKEGETTYSNEGFEVTIFDEEDLIDSPKIIMHVQNEIVEFPGAYRLRDLKFLLYFYYGEDAYCEKFSK